MKKLKKFLKSLWIFILCLFPKGKEKVFYDQALANMQEANTLTTLQKRMLQGEINWFINEHIKKRILPESAKILLIQNKFEKKLKNSGFKIDPTTNKLVNA